MKLWRLTRAAHVALDGVGALAQGGRYSPPGVPVVSLASEAGLAVLVALRYLPADPPDDYVLGWTEVDVQPQRIPDEQGEEAIRRHVADWLAQNHSLIAAIRSKVLPEADVILFNPRHGDAASVPPFTTRPFSFAECLHVPPMLARFSGER